MRKLIIAFLSLLLLLFIVGCTSEAKKDRNDAPISEEDGLSGTLEIQYFVGGYGDKWWKEVISDFQNKYPELEIVEHSGPNINDEMRPRWISDNPPDIVYIDGAGSSETQMVEDGQLMDITEWVQSITLDDETPLMEKFIVPPSVYDDKVYSLPLLFDTRGIWYDHSWFNENGYEVPSNYQEWMSSMEKIKNDKDIAPIAANGVYPNVFLRGVLYPAFGSAGGEELLADLIKGEEGAWKREETLSVMKKVEEMQKAGFLDPGFAALNHTQAQLNLLLHESAYAPSGFWLPNEMASDVPDDFEFRMIPTPMNEKGKPMVVVPDIRTIAIAEKAKNPKAAKAFLEFAFEEHYAIKFSELTGAMMNMQEIDLASNEDVSQYLIEANKLINDPSKVELKFLPHQMNSELESPIGDALIALMLGEIDAEEFVQRAEEAANSYRKNS